MGVSIFNAVSAIGGGITLVTGTLPVPKDLLRHTPFESYVIPGLCLGVVIGGSAIVGAVALLSHARSLPVSWTGQVSSSRATIRVAAMRHR